MSAENVVPVNCWQTITAISVTITAVLSVFMFFWSLFTEESRYRWRLRLRIVKPNLSLEVHSQKDLSEPVIFLVNRGPKIQSKIILEVWHRPRYWTTHIWTTGKSLDGDSQAFQLCDDGISTYGQFPFDPPERVKEIGSLEPPDDKGAKWEQEFLKWKITMLGLTVNEGVAWLPEPQTPSSRSSKARANK